MKPLDERALEHFAELCELGREAQDERLAMIADPEVRSQVRELLDGDRSPVKWVEGRAVVPPTLLAEFSSLAPDGPNEPRLRAGMRLGDFEIEGLLGRGGMGEVYCARQLSLNGRPVALKVMSSDDQAPKNIERFQREALLLADLHHPSLAAVYGFGERNGVLFIAMHLVRGPTLQEIHATWLSKPPAFEERRAWVLTWMTQIGDALRAVHEKGLVHRDIKPSNIVLDGFEPPHSVGRAVLIDFGLVRAVARGQHTRTGALAFTPGYAAPEQLLGRPGDMRSDVFSIGVTMHDLLATRSPRERDPEANGPRSLEELLPNCDRDLSAVLAKATAHEARWRYADAGALLRDLHALREGAETAARRRRFLERTQRWLSSRSVRLLQGTLLAVGGFVALWGLLYWREGMVHVDAAHRARDMADIEGILEESQSVPGLLRRFGGVEDYAKIPISRDSEDALGRIVWFLRADDVSRAMREVVTELRLHGPAEKPLLVRYLARALGERDSQNVPTPRAVIALRFAARLFYERPNVTLADEEASAPLRDAIIDLLRASPMTVGRYAVSALAGCGTAADVPRILSLAGSVGAGSEDERLCFKAADRILHRFNAGGRTSELELEEIIGILAELGPPLFARMRVEWIGADHRDLDEAESLRYMCLYAFLDLWNVVGFVRRRTGPAAPPHELIDLCVKSTEAKRTHPTLLLTIRAAFGDPSARSAIVLEGAPLGKTRYWGCLCGFLGDAETTERCRAACATPEARSDFDAGLLAGIEDREGRRSLTFDLDPDTLLGAGLPSRENLVLSPGEDALPVGTLARWRFAGESCRGSGGATAASMLGAQILLDEGGSDRFVRLAPGESDLRLGLVVDERPGDAVSLVLDDQTGGRGYYPMQGEVALDIEVDGRLVQSLWFPGTHRRQHVDLPTGPAVRLSSLVFEPGEHEIVLKMGSLSTTTYRLYQVELRTVEER